jgi:hypothetical protein
MQAAVFRGRGRSGFARFPARSLGWARLSSRYRRGDHSLRSVPGLSFGRAVPVWTRRRRVRSHRRLALRKHHRRLPGRVRAGSRCQANLAKIPDGVTDEEVLLCPDIMSIGFSAAQHGHVRLGSRCLRHLYSSWSAERCVPRRTLSQASTSPARGPAGSTIFNPPRLAARSPIRTARTRRAVSSSGIHARTPWHPNRCGQKTNVTSCNY